MADMSTLEVEADVTEASIGKVVVGGLREITLDALPECAAGRSVAHRADGGPGEGDRAGEVAFVERDPAPCRT